MMRKRLSIRALAGMTMLAAAMFSSSPVNAQTKEECYVLTNGSVFWYEGTTWQLTGEGKPRYQCEIAQNHRPAPYNDTVDLHVTDGDHVTLITEKGVYYAKLDTTTNPATVVATETFDEFCVWKRTGSTGYYFQEYGDYLYYLLGGKTGLEVRKQSRTAATDKMSQWFNWDFGAAVKEIIFTDGRRAERYYWLMCDSVSHEWTMSCHSYERPETAIYDDYDFSGTTDAALHNIAVKDYYCSRAVNRSTMLPTGHGALVMPMNITHYEKQLPSNLSTFGLQGVTYTDFDVHEPGAPNDMLAFGTAATVNTSIIESASANDAIQVTPAYAHYAEETYRYGINTWWRMRTEDTWNNGGIPTIVDRYYYNGSFHETAPTSSASNLVVESVTYNLTPSSFRYLKFEVNGTEIDAPGPQTITNYGTDVVKIACYQVPPQTANVKLTVTVRYTNGVEQTGEYPVPLSSYYHRQPMPTATNAPVVHGSVFGGGRMANVVQNTHVTVHNTDSIYALYGGNDIAGWVQGDGGANLRIGTERTSSAAPVKIGWVYGGGCGYYTYRGINVSDSLGYPYSPGTDQYGVRYQNYYFGSSDPDHPGDVTLNFDGTVYPWGTVPTWQAGHEHEAGYEVTADDTAYLDWSAFAGSVVATGFRYDPVSDDPAHVDNSETGNNGTGTIPYVKTSHIVVGTGNVANDHILIDTIFGGAENAFIGVESFEETPANAITMDINGGTIYAVFGGNNYGGAVAQTSTVLLNVHGTSLPDVLKTVADADSTHEWPYAGYKVRQQTDDRSVFTGFGREYGIRYLYGGGNMVDGSHALVTINGGILDTVFGGGNAADVNLPAVVVNCTGTNFICDNLSYWEDPSNPIGPDYWQGEVGNYNIRSLFGGNNHAASSTLGYLQLESGGISCVYGGGNQGDMNNTKTITRAALLSMMGSTLVTSGIPAPVAVGSIVYSPFDSKIVCDYVFGGCRMANVKHSSGAVLYGGTFGYVNGGNDVSGDVGSTVGTTLYTAAWPYGEVTENAASAVRGNRDGAYTYLSGNVLVVGDALGGSDGYYHCSADGVYYDDSHIEDTYDGVDYDPYNEFVGKAMPTHNNTFMAMFIDPAHSDYRPRVLGSVMAGGAHANVGFDENVTYEVVPADGVKNGSTRLELRGGYVGGNVFGGGYMADVFGLGYLHVGGTMEIAGSLFAGNDLLGSIGAFGAYTPDGIPATLKTPVYNSSDGTPLNDYEGTSWNAQYSCYLLIDGTPQINEVYGGGNGAYNYDGLPELEELYGEMPSVCPPTNGKDNRPQQSSSYIDLNVTGGRVETVYGGGNGIGVRDAVTVLLNSRNDPGDGEFVGTIFGGNNRDDMTQCVPDIQLKNGQVGNVYGGGNQGSMRSSAEFTDVCGNNVAGVSTHIKLDNSSQAVVNGTIYGGCRMADVTGMAYIEIRGSNVDVLNVFGGNDVSGSVTGNTRIDVSAGTVHNIFGGSNGYYDYVFVNNKFDAYTYHSEHIDANLQARGTSGAPFVDSTTVNLYGGTITTDVYGGGKLGDCRLTLVEVDDRACPALAGDLEVQGAIYGGGKGIDDNLNATRRGNVLTPEDSDSPSRTHVNLRHADNLHTTGPNSKVVAYGGGRGGDVMDTYIEAFSTWDTPFDEIYGGCWGSDVLGETHLTLNGSEDPTAKTASSVYGGNDFTGATYRTNVTINGGRYDNIFGGGNGEYDQVHYQGGTWNDEGTVFTTSSNPADAIYAGNYTEDDTVWNKGITIGGPRRLFEPNNENAIINFNDGTVDGNVYGGGRMGTTMYYRRNADGEWLTQAGGASKWPDAFRTQYHYGTTTPFDPALYPDSIPLGDSNYSKIIINVKNGTFEHNIYAGGMGKDGGNWIVYGIKVLNMENGLVKESVYGGSENVSDGYARECLNDTNTTERPSSILNITGGTIKNNVYGGGYLGNVHGSVYVNIGIQAVENCVLWDKTIYGQANAYAKYKPGAANGYAPALTANELQLQASVYGGANWGDNVGSSDFSKQGFYGGESRILVDGEGYNTYMDAAHESLPLFNIVHSLIGAGTSASGGDILNRIDLRNYGAVNPGTCKPTRQLKAIQRAHEVWLENTAVNYTGATDAISAFLSQQFTINRVDTLNCVGYNVIDINATATNIANVNFLYNKAYSDALAAAHSSGTDRIERTLQWFEPSMTYMYALNGLMPDSNICAENATICDKLSLMDRDVDSKSITALVINNGINVDIIGANSAYGAINGFALMVAQERTNAVVTARAKFVSFDATENGNPVHYDGHERDGGFVTSCINDFQAVNHTDGTTLEWCDCFEEDTAIVANNPFCVGSSPWRPRLSEFPYSNYSTTYRVWKLGDGKRRRYTVIQAHSNPDSMYTMEGNTKVYSNKKATLRYTKGSIDNLYNFSIAEAKLILPPTSPDNYYRISAAGVTIDDENQEMRLTDVSYKPMWDSLENEWMLNGITYRAATGSDAEGVTYEDDDNGRWDELTPPVGSEPIGAEHIHDFTDGKQYFGLMMCSGNNFAQGTDAEIRPLYAGDSWHDGTTISGNSFTNMVQNFSTARVDALVNASPEINLYLLYDNNFSHTLIGTITFTLEEHKAVRRRLGYDSEAASPWLTNGSGGAAYWDDEHGNPVYIDSNLNADIEVEVTVTTILQDFASMEYEVLAMYNEGRSNQFARKVVLPATLQQRELFIDSLSWFPTDTMGDPNPLVTDVWANGDTITFDRNPDWFHLTDNMNTIKSGTGYFGMTVLPTDNVSNTLTAANSWHSIVQEEPLDLFSAVYGATVLGNGITDTLVSTQPAMRAYKDKYFNGSGATDTIARASLINAANPHGVKLGNLDGRGDAALNVTLFYDGNRIYNSYLGKGYIGKVVLYMASYTGGDYSKPDRFKITINVKTRASGDTIYLASNDYFDVHEAGRDRHYVTPGKYAQKCDWTADEEHGKNPQSCITTFYDALTKVYQEGDVLAIVGGMKIGEGEQLLIKGQEYMPIPVIRYEGHHNMLPGEACVYRGTMITVEGTAANPASFTARCIEFKGSMLSKIEPNPATDGTTDNPTTAFTNAHPRTYNPIDDDDYKYADTNIAFGPIISVKSNGTVMLQNGVIVEHNNNGYWSPAYRAAHPGEHDEDFDPSRMGAISVSGGRLKLINNVNIKHNLYSYDTTLTPTNPPSSIVPATWGIHPISGAVYVDGGEIYIEESHRTTAIHIDSNYLADSIPYWLEHSEGGNLRHYDFNDVDTNDGYYADNLHRTRANVYLERLSFSDSTQAYRDMNDSTSRVIVFDMPLTENTRIGVTKWFPDDLEELRDTIQIAFQADGTYLQEAENNHNFIPDNPHYFTFYNYGIDNVRMYLGRCATFKYQQHAIDPVSGTLTELVRTGSGVFTDTAIYYRPLKGASCPTGGDTIITRAQGGFFPYTYTWYDAGNSFVNTEDDVVLRTRKTSSTNKIVTNKYNTQPYNYAPLASAVADTLLTDNIEMPYGTNDKTLRYLVTIKDATEHCTLTKQVKVRLVKSSGDVVPFVRTGDSEQQANWTALDKPNTIGDTCTGDRSYSAVSITPRIKSPGTGAIAIVNETLQPGQTHSDIHIISGDNEYTIVDNPLKFCQGDVLSLYAMPVSHLEVDTEADGYDPNESFENNPKKRVNDSKFMMWDFDPYYSNPTSHVVPSHDETVVAYFSPLGYWKDSVTSTSIAHAVYDDNFTYRDRAHTSDPAAGMVTTYNGDVHIYNENGLAWFISCINGFNGTQARTFHYNRVYIHYKENGYDMKDCKWTPMGTLQHPFEGMLIGVGADGDNADSLIAPWSRDANGDPEINGSGDTVWTDPIIIKNIIVDEPNLENAGFFAVLDSARIINIQLQGATIRGAQNVGTLAARSSNGRMRRVNIASAPDPLSDAADDPTTTILSTHYLSGGMIGLSTHDTIIASEMIAAKFIGDAVYSGGVYGTADGCVLQNSTGQNINRMRGLYVGGMAGRFDGTAPGPNRLFHRKTAGAPSRVENNYFRVSTEDGESQRVGGVAGYAENTIIANNYIYGDLGSTVAKGGVTAVAADGTRADHNYYEVWAAKIPTDDLRGNAVMEDVSLFTGEGNHVTLANPVYGIDNMTRALNKWVREHNADGGHYKTWRSDLNERNNGYPMFGQPDMIPVEGRLVVEGCEEVEFEGNTYTVDITLTTNVVDTVEMIDSTTTVTITVHHGTRTEVADSAVVTDGYEGYGFTVTPTEAMLLNSTLQQRGTAQLVLCDTLQTVFGCDSIVTLTLTFTPGLDIPTVDVKPESTINVYPNPTTSEVNIEAEQMSHVELYDNEGRRLADYDAHGGDKIRINVSQLASGIYYLRVHTPHAVTIQKIVKR